MEIKKTFAGSLLDLKYFSDICAGKLIEITVDEAFYDYIKEEFEYYINSFMDDKNKIVFEGKMLGVKIKKSVSDGQKGI